MGSRELAFTISIRRRVDRAAFHQLAGRDQEALVEDVRAFRPHAQPAEVDQMRGAGGEADDAPPWNTGIIRRKSLRCPEAIQGSLVR
jgi:hypothetical protein